MLGLRYFACEDCERVHASPDVPPACGRCGGAVREVTAALRGDDYFTRTFDDDPRLRLHDGAEGDDA